MVKKDMSLTHFNKARQELELARSIDEVKGLRDKAEAMRIYCKQANESLDMQNHCAEIKLRAERKGGELLREQKEAGERDAGKGGDRKSRSSSVTVKPKLSDLGITKNQSSQWQAVASLPEEVFEEHIEETKAKKKELTTSDMVKLAKKEEKLIENEELRKRACPLPEGQYSVVLADPPWEYSFSRSANRRISNQYPTLSLDEIKAFVTQDIFAKDCVLFLWVPSPKAEEGFEVLKAWGFTYKTCAIWDKIIMGMGYYFRQQHELLFVGTKGSLPVPEPSARVSSIIESRRGKHSQKPTKLYKIIEDMYPGEPKLELFQRKKREGWTGHGNENV